MLMPAAKYLHMRSDLRAISDKAPSKNTVHTDVYIFSNNCIRMRKKRTERYPAVQ